MLPLPSSLRIYILRDIAHPEPAENPFSDDYVRRLVGGDRTVEDHFNQWFRALLVVKARRNYRARKIVDDVVQETFLRVLRNLRRDPDLLDRPEKLGAYVLAVCNNVILELTRSENRYVGMDGAENQRPDPAADAIESLCDEERRRQVQAIVSALAPRDQALLRLVFLEEQDKDLVCKQMNVDRDYLRVVLHRAIQRCKSIVRPVRNPGLGGMG